MAITRREFIQRAAAAGALSLIPSLPSCGEAGGDGLPVYRYSGPLGPADLFRDGIASGDPLPDAVVLWARADPRDAAAQEVAVFVEVALDATFARRISASTFMTGPERDYTLKVDATELEPATTYYYRFSALGRTSPVGRTRTAPSGPTDRLRWAVCSCSNYAFGYFHAYRHMAQRADLDAFIHLGDYIYEYATSGAYGETYGEFRPLEPPHEILSLADYRLRYAHYRRDPDLQELHRQHPVIHLWDDHEFADDPVPGGADNHDPGEGSWPDRVTAALQACDEWMPTRLGDDRHIYRDRGFGDLAHMFLLDRQWRWLRYDGSFEDLTKYLGAVQERWFYERLPQTQAQWLILGLATTFAPRSADGRRDTSWGDADRARLLREVKSAGYENVVILIGDIHSAQALDVVEDPAAYDPVTGAGSGGVELSTGSITSPGGGRDVSGIPQWFWEGGRTRGYMVVDLTAERMQCDFFGFDDALKEQAALPEERWLSGWVALAGTNHLTEASAPLSPRSDPPPLAP